MFRKLLTKPVWWWERRRGYPIRARHHALPSLPVEAGKAKFVVLTTPQTLDDALWSAWSWYRYLKSKDFGLHLAIDGKISEGGAAAARKLFPGISIYEAAPMLDGLCEAKPELAIFLRNHPLGKKLGLVLALSAQEPILFSDHDVLAFDSPVELLSRVEKGIPCYMMEEYEGNIDTAMIERAKSIGADYISKMNSGLLYVPQNALSLDLAAGLLATWRPPVSSWFTEQTVLNILMRHANAEPLPGQRYVVSARRQFYWEKDVDYRTIAARHFTGPVRHVMYRYGMPEVLRESKHWIH